MYQIEKSNQKEEGTRRSSYIYLFTKIDHDRLLPCTIQLSNKIAVVAVLTQHRDSNPIEINKKIDKVFTVKT
jgi:hypothetical protein